MTSTRDEAQEANHDVSATVAEAVRERPYKRYVDSALGLRNYWYPAFFSEELDDGATRAEEICGERIFFKRVEDDGVYAIQDRCAHRGVAFSARPECHSKNTITCWFHGFTYDVRDGKLAHVITQPDSNLTGKITLPTYPVREAFGLVWVYIGDGEPIPFEEDLPPVLQRSLRGEERRAYRSLVRVKIPCDWRLAVENGFDSGHIYGHRDATIVERGLSPNPLSAYPQTRKGTSTDTTPGRAAAMFFNFADWKMIWRTEVEGTEVKANGLILEETDGQSDDGSFDTASGLETDMMAAHLPCLLEIPGFPGGRQTHFEWFVPVDEHHHMYVMMASSPVDSDEEEQEFFDECATKWAPLVWSTDPEIIGFNNYDAFGREQVAHAYEHEDFWNKEHLYKPDYVMVQWRMFVSKVARGIQRRTGLAPKSKPEPSQTVYLNR
ncbi:Rieske 2Fe-2S domain-containing protein [Streptomyces sp. NPDC055078]